MEEQENKPVQAKEVNSLSFKSAFVIIVMTVSTLLLANFAQSKYSGKWKEVGSMSEPRYEDIVLENNGKLHIFSGFRNGTRDVAKNDEIYDLKTNKTEIVPPMPTLKTHAGVARVGDDVWFIGGFKFGFPGEVISDVQIFNFKTSKWRQGPELPIKVGSGGAAYAGGKIHYFGGILEDRQTDTAAHYVIDPKNLKKGWLKLQDQPYKRNHFGTIVLGDKILLVGGERGHDQVTETQNVVYAYNFKQDSWQRLSDLPQPRSHFECGQIVVNGKYAIMGGRNKRMMSMNSMLIYNDKDDSWSELANMPRYLIAASAYADNDYLYVFGGGDGSYNYPQKKVYSMKLPDELRE